jgi:8-oxo-dGTP diphosphatase
VELIKTLKETDVFPGVNESKDSSYEARRAARAIVRNGSGEIALLYVSSRKYHKLPGGGLEDGEDVHGALLREVKEETGCEIRVVGEVGKIVEYRDEWELKQTSYCFLAKPLRCGEPSFTEKETRQGFRLKWVKPDEALELIRGDEPTSYEGKFIRLRDMAFLEKAAGRYKLL